MTNRRGAKSRPVSLALAVGFAVTTAMLAFSGPSGAQVSTVRGSAFGYFADNITLFGGAQPDTGPTPIVTLPAAGGSETATATEGLVQYGPATLFSSGPITVTTTGTTGANGSVTSTATIENVNRLGSEVFTATSISSTCTASETGTTGSTTVVNGTIQSVEGTVQVPTNPAPNTTFEGTVPNVNDRFRYVFNEQIVNPDGSITVNAAHLYLLGPTARGDLIIGQVVCGVTATQATTTTTQATTTTTQATTTTTQATTTTTQATTTTTQATTTTTQPTTTTTQQATTTTTQPTTTTTTAPGATCAGMTPTIVGTAGDDHLRGTDGPDVIMGLGGDDHILGLQGDDVICGGPGDDRLIGGPGNDRLFGGPGDDHLVGGPGDDDLHGGPGKDKCAPGSGVDTVRDCEEHAGSDDKHAKGKSGRHGGVLALVVRALRALF